MRILLYYFAITAIVAAPLATSVTIGPAKIALEDTTFAMVAKQLGESQLVHAGDAGGGRVQACYITTGPAPTTYYLESSEMGGGDYITQVDVVGAGTTTAAEGPIVARRCSALASIIGVARTNSGIMLGLSRAQVEHQLRLRRRDSAGVTLYEKSEKHGSGAKVYDVFSWARVRYLKGTVAAFSIGKVSTT